MELNLNELESEMKSKIDSAEKNNPILSMIKGFLKDPKMVMALLNSIPKTFKIVIVVAIAELLLGVIYTIELLVKLVLTIINLF